MKSIGRLVAVGSITIAAVGAGTLFVLNRTSVGKHISDQPVLAIAHEPQSVWTKHVDGSPSQVLFSPKIIYAVIRNSSGDVLDALERGSGNVLWHVAVDGVLGMRLIDQTIVLYQSEGPDIYFQAIGTKAGDKLWRTDADGYRFTSNLGTGSDIVEGDGELGVISLASHRIETRISATGIQLNDNSAVAVDAGVIQVYARPSLQKVGRVDSGEDSPDLQVVMLGNTVLYNSGESVVGRSLSGERIFRENAHVGKIVRIRELSQRDILVEGLSGAKVLSVKGAVVEVGYSMSTGDSLDLHAQTSAGIFMLLQADGGRLKLVRVNGADTAEIGSIKYDPTATSEDGLPGPWLLDGAVYVLNSPDNANTGTLDAYSLKDFTKIWHLPNNFFFGDGVVLHYVQSGDSGSQLELFG
jgi:outer membrane protein assembly factor BamB